MAVADIREVQLPLDDESGSSCLHLLAASITGFDLVVPKQDGYFVVLFRTGAFRGLVLNVVREVLAHLRWASAP